MKILACACCLGLLALFPVIAHAGLFNLSEQDEIAIGREAAAKVEQQVRLYPDEGVQGYVSQLGMQLARLSTRPNLPWRFRVIDDPHINAFSLPGGFIYVNSRVLQVAASEAQLAAVLAHEIGHIEGRHHKKKIEQAMRYQLGLGVLGAAIGSGGGADAAMIAGQLLAQGELTRFSREAENDADRRGVALLYRAGFDPMAMSRFLERLVALEPGNPDMLSRFFADHPAPRERVAVTRALARSYKPLVWRTDSAAFLRISRRLGGAAESGKEGQRIPEMGGARILPRHRQMPGAVLHPMRP
jgi:predicted Zn-dependent protease